LATNNTATGTPPNNSQVLAASTEVSVLPYGTDAPIVALNPQSVSPVGGSQPHTNFQPYLCVDFIISLFGIFPSPT
jgi:microcystin-dependent protein